MDIREVTKALQDATTTLEKMNLVMRELIAERDHHKALALKWATDADRLQIELNHWEGTYGAKATSVQP